MESLLPPEIKLDIFSRLPAPSVLQCRQVCKSWRTLLHHPCFADMHLRQLLHQPDNLGILYMNGKYDGSADQPYYGEYDENDEQSYKSLKRINHPPVRICANCLESCNGLICLCVNRNSDGLDDSIYICNPITREFVNLPVYKTDLSQERYIIRDVVYGFGYLPSTNQYKVVGILYYRDRENTQSSRWVGSVQVYTLGASTGWRKIGEITDLLLWYSVSVNGALHYLDDYEPKIVAFDLADEEFRLLQTPPCFVHSPDDFFFLRVLGGLLCLVHEKRNESINIWSLKKNDCTTYVMKEQENQSWSWHREVGMTWEGLGTHDSEVFAITGNGGVLLWLNLGIRSDEYKHSILCCYNPKTATFKRMDSEMLFVDAIPHMNSLVSLKALGEDAKIIGSAEGLLEQEISQSNREVENSSSTPY